MQTFAYVAKLCVSPFQTFSPDLRSAFSLCSLRVEISFIDPLALAGAENLRVGYLRNGLFGQKRVAQRTENDVSKATFARLRAI